jgi:hypothetical protein
MYAAFIKKTVTGISRHQTSEILRRSRALYPGNLKIIPDMGRCEEHLFYDFYIRCEGLAAIHMPGNGINGLTFN